MTHWNISITFDVIKEKKKLVVFGIDEICCEKIILTTFGVIRQRKKIIFEWGIIIELISFYIFISLYSSMKRIQKWDISW